MIENVSSTSYKLDTKGRMEKTTLNGIFLAGRKGWYFAVYEE